MIEPFLAALDPEERERFSAFPGLPESLARLAAAVGDPELDVPRFLRDVALRVEGDPEAALAAVRAGDLALATACARGEAAALARFDREMAGPIAAAFGRHRGAPITLDELRQAMRDRLLVATQDTPPRITSYAGRGALEAWVRMATARHLLDVMRADAARPDRPGSDDAIADLAVAGDDPELAFLKRQYREEFRAAFRSVLATLPARDRNILRHRYLDALEVGEIATIYGMHRASMSRALGRIRDGLLAGIRRELLRRLDVGADELDSIMKLLASQLELSLSGLLNATSP